MFARHSFLATVAVLVLVPGLRAQSGPRIRVPKGLPAELAMQLLGTVGDYAISLEGRIKEDSSTVQLHPPTGPSLSYSVPVNVELTGSDDNGLPFTTIQVTVSVRCVCIVSYDLKRVRIEGNDLVFPEPRVVAAYVDPPGQRGRWTSNASFFRSRTSASIAALKAKLVDDALGEARRQYLHAQHPAHERQWAGKVHKKLVTLAENHSRKSHEVTSTEARGNSDGPNRYLWGSLLAILVLVGILAVVYLSRRR